VVMQWHYLRSVQHPQCCDSLHSCRCLEVHFEVNLSWAESHCASEKKFGIVAPPLSFSLHAPRFYINLV